MLPVSVIPFAVEDDEIRFGRVDRILHRRIDSNGQQVRYSVLTTSVCEEKELTWSRVLRGSHVRIPCFLYASAHNSPVGIGAELALKFMQALQDSQVDWEPTRLIVLAADRFTTSVVAGRELRGALVGFAVETK